jgi:hypothetical protein
MGRAKARGRGPLWSDTSQTRPGTDAPMAIDKARQGARACAGHAALGHDPMQAMTAWAPMMTEEIPRGKTQGRTPGQ